MSKKITRNMMMKKLHNITKTNWRLSEVTTDNEMACIYRDIATLAQAVRMFNNVVGQEGSDVEFEDN